VSDFKRLQPAVFSGTERPLDVEQWIMDTTHLMKAARIPDENQVEVAKIQLKDVARTWWLAEEARLEKPITWDQFRWVSMRGFSRQRLRKRWKSSSSGYNS